MSKVYFITHPDGFVKIGKSNDPAQRLSDLQTSCPYELSIGTVIHDGSECESDERLERALHGYYSNFHVRGEWYDLPGDELDSLKKFGRLKASEVKSVTGSRKAHPDGVDVPLGELLADSALHKW
jgi:hypothetical protein